MGLEHMTAIHCSFHTSEEQEPSKMLLDTGTYFPPSEDSEQIHDEHETQSVWSRDVGRDTE